METIYDIIREGYDKAEIKDGKLMVNNLDITIDLNNMTDFNWTIQNSVNKAFRLHTTRDILYYLYFMYIDTKSSIYIEYIKTIMFDWIKKNPYSKPLDNHSWYDMSVSIRSRIFIFFYKLLKNNITTPEKDIIFTSLIEHLLFLKDDSNYIDNNHGLYTDLAIFQFKYDFPEIKDIDAICTKSVTRFITNLTKFVNMEEGLSKEHSTNYHRLYAHIVKNALNLNISDNKLVSFFENYKKNMKWFILPNNHYIQFGDTDAEPLPNEYKLIEVCREVSGHKLFNTGFAFVKGNNYHLGVTSCFHMNAHKHLDDCSFELFDNNKKIIVDSGRYTYNSNDNRKYFVSHNAHNTLCPKNLKRNSVPFYGSGLVNMYHDDPYYIINCENKYALHAYGIKHMRKFIYIPNTKLEIHDVISYSDKPIDISLFFHFDHSIEETDLEKLFKIKSNSTSKYELKIITTKQSLYDETYVENKCIEICLKKISGNNLKHNIITEFVLDK
jgi:hypothetical protein